MSDVVLDRSLFTDWLIDGERGVSSEAMLSHLTGGSRRDRDNWDHPFDCDDFRRCELLLRAVPVARLVLSNMATRSPAWANLVTVWPAIVSLMEEEAPGIFDRKRWPEGARCPKAYALIKEAIR